SGPDRGVPLGYATPRYSRGARVDGSCIRRHSGLAHGLSRQFEFDAMAVMHEAIQDRIGERRLTEVGVPFVDGQLASDQARAGVDAVIEDFQEIRAVLGGERGQSPV